MLMNPHISRQLADARRRDMLADAQHRSLVRWVSIGPGSTRQLTQHLRRLRAVARPGTAALA
jgi:hypothetical protein